MDIEKLKKLVRDNPVQTAAGALAVLLVAGVVAFTIYLNGQGNNKGFAVEGSRLIVVKDGMTTADIAELLHEKKLVKNPAAFKMEARWKGLATKLQAGAYQIDGGMSNQQIVDVMVKGRIKQVRFTVPEGYSVAKTAKKWRPKGLAVLISLWRRRRIMHLIRICRPITAMCCLKPRALSTRQPMISRWESASRRCSK